MSRARSRKRRPRGGQAARGNGRPRDGAAPVAAETPRRAARSRSSPAAPTFGEPPRAPWHPLPLSELLILVGAVGTVIGMKRLGAGRSNGASSLLVGLAVVAIGTIEVTLREHRSGYRSHTVLLSLLPLLVLDSLVVLGVSVLVTPPRLLTVGLLALDIALFVLLFRALRARFLEARHARVLKEG